MIAWVVEEEFSVSIIPAMGANCFTAEQSPCNGPRRVLARADPAA
jgi:hypothetical protein